MSPEEKEQLYTRIDSIKTDFIVEMKTSFQHFNDYFLNAVVKVIEDKLDEHQKTDHKRMTRIEERIYMIERHLGINNDLKIENKKSKIR